MQTLFQAFLALLLAHLATDFVFQSDEMTLRKGKGSWGSFAKHGAVHLFVSFVSVGLTNPAWLKRPNSYAVVVCLSVAHLLIDWGKIALTSSQWTSDKLSLFLTDQALHAGTVAAAALVLVGSPLHDLLSEVARAHFDKQKILVLLVVYTGTLFAGGHLVRYLTQPVLKRTPLSLDESTDTLEHAGMYVGWLERFIVVTALVLQSPATVGLILTAKSIARYPEFKSVRFAEYFLLGTLLSLSIGIGGGLLLQKMFYGTILVPK
jgi:hypothetical protein